MRPRLVISTTVPETLNNILRDQPRFLRQHFDVVLVTSSGNGFDELKREDVPVYTIPMNRGISLLNDLVSVYRMIQLFLRLKPEIVHSYTPKAGLVCMLAAWFCRVPVRVHTFTGLIWPTELGMRRKLLKVVDRLICFCSTNIVPEGEGVLNDLKSAKITSKYLKVIGFGNIAGVDVDFFSRTALGLECASKALQQYCGIEDDNFVFVYVGRLNRDKGLQVLLPAFTELPTNCHLVVVGGIDSEAPVDPESMELLKSHPRIHWLGFQRDTRPAIIMSNVLVLPSYREGFPNVLLHAGAMELASIATDISGCNEIITPGYNGWLVPVKDVQALVNVMMIANNTSPADLELMGKSARERVVQRFERAAHWERLLDFYQSLLLSSQKNEAIF